MIPNACNASKIHVHIFVIILIHCYINIIKYIHSFVLANRVESTHYSYYTNKYMDTINANTNEQSADDTCKVYECNICYDNSVDCEMITLNCCNHTKHICIRCVNCLSKPICPYCRKKIDDKCIPYLQQIDERNYSQSEPVSGSDLDEFLIQENRDFIESYNYSFEDFLSEENIINPYLYDNSRRLRRQIRRLRYEFMQRRTENQRDSSRSRRRNRNRNRDRSINLNHHHHHHHHHHHWHTSNRSYLQDESRRVTKMYNNINRFADLQDDILDDEMLFHIET